MLVRDYEDTCLGPQYKLRVNWPHELVAAHDDAVGGTTQHSCLRHRRLRDEDPEVGESAAEVLHNGFRNLRGATWKVEDEVEVVRGSQPMNNLHEALDVLCGDAKRLGVRAGALRPVGRVDGDVPAR